MPATDNAHQAAHTCLLCTDITDKVALAQQLWHDWQARQLTVRNISLALSLQAGQPRRPVMVAPNQLIKRKLRSRTGQASIISKQTPPIQIGCGSSLMYCSPLTPTSQAETQAINGVNVTLYAIGAMASHLIAYARHR